MQHARLGYRSTADYVTAAGLFRSAQEKASLVLVPIFMMIAGTSHAEVTVVAREPPDEIATAAAPPAAAPESRLTITANVPFEKMAAIANRYQFGTHANGTAMAGLISYDAILSLGKIKLMVSDQDQFPIRIEAPFTLNGTLGGGTLNEVGQANINFAVRVQENWCPIVELGNINVALDSAPRAAAAIAPAGPSLSEFVATQFLGRQLREWATCDDIKKAINRFWHPFAFAIDTDARVFFNVDPSSIALSQATVSGKNLRFVAAIGTVVSIGSKKANSVVKPLPRVMSPPAGELPAEIGVNISLNLP